jgi:type I restriction-modification system DNA methylase subunit
MTTDGLIHTMNDKDIEEKIKQYLSVKEEEKNKHGEVFTPVKIIEEMLDKLPNKIWSNPELKWLEPASGIGNFFMAVYSRLLKGLEKWEPN